MNNDINKIQKYLIERLDKLSNDEYMKDNLKNEISRSNAVTSASLAFIKAKNLELRVNSLLPEQRKTIKKVSE